MVGIMMTSAIQAIGEVIDVLRNRPDFNPRTAMLANIIRRMQCQALRLELPMRL
jgi:hypothetical protein